MALLANVPGLGVFVAGEDEKTPTASESSGGLWLLESNREERGRPVLLLLGRNLSKRNGIGVSSQ